MNKIKITNPLMLAFYLFISVALVFLCYRQLSSNKIAYVDSARIMNEYHASVEARKQYQLKAKAWQDNVDTLTTAIKVSIKKYEKDLADMSAREQSMARQLIGNQQKQLQDYQRAVQENAGQENAKLTQSVVNEVNAFLLKYGKENNYELILIANQSGTIAYGKEGLDITANVVEKLNKEYKGK